MPTAWRRAANWCSRRGRSDGTRKGISRGSQAEQVEQALLNVVAVLAEGGAGPEHLVRLTWFVTDRQAYVDAQAEIGAAYRRVLGQHYPAMSLVEVSALVEAQALVEIEATAVIPD